MSATASPALACNYRASPVRPDAVFATLYPRTIEIARHYAGGFQIKEIYALFGVRKTVVSRELDRFRAATGAVSRRDFVLACRRHGIDPV